MVAILNWAGLKSELVMDVHIVIISWKFDYNLSCGSGDIFLTD